MAVRNGQAQVLRVSVTRADRKILQDGTILINMIALNKKAIFTIAIFLAVAVGAVAIGQFIRLRKAHSTFNNYYAFRGCTQLIEKTDTYGTCKLSNGTTIKIILIDGKWYLDGDGPGVW